MLLQGIPAASGYAIGQAFILEHDTSEVERKQVDDVQAEATRLQTAVQQAMNELEQIKEDTAKN